MTTRVSWLAIVLLGVTLLASTACSSSRYPRYGRYGSVYGQTGRPIYGPNNRDYRWQRQQQRAREAWLRKERKLERQERRRNRDRNEWRRRGRD